MYCWCLLQKKLARVFQAITRISLFSLLDSSVPLEWVCPSLAFLIRLRQFFFFSFIRSYFYWTLDLSHRFFWVSCRATQEDELGELYLTNIDFLKNGVPASIIATLVSFVQHQIRALKNITCFLFKGRCDGWIPTDETHRVRGSTWKIMFKPRNWHWFLDCELMRS